MVIKKQSGFQAMKETYWWKLPTLTHQGLHEDYSYTCPQQKKLSAQSLMTDGKASKYPVYFVCRALRANELKINSKLTTIAVNRQTIKANYCLVQKCPENAGNGSLNLEGYDIQYRPRTAIKGQILVDFIVE
ncbi:hypothetical protein Tco_1249413 [Tanacetum coccineum]